ncbi:MAG: folate family ECF transporter S component [Butyrivibrio sp.]|nr:folate family ECF transporter S component [Butyrivibrio sp.]
MFKKVNEVKSLWISSLHEFQKLKVVVFCGMMCALAIVLSYVTTIRIGPYIKVGFSSIPNKIVDLMFGPAIGSIFGASLDVIKYLIAPDGPFFPGFTISAFLGGLVYGAAFYKKPVSIVRIFVAELIVKLFINVVLNTFWLDMLYGKGFIALIPSRIVSNAIMLPVDTIVTFLILKALEKTLHKMLA